MRSESFRHEEKHSAHSHRAIEDKFLLHHDLNVALKKLSSKYREPLLLYTKENFSYHEISQILNIKVGTVKSRISMAKEKLSILIEKR